jgi:hypothetical protein
LEAKNEKILTKKQGFPFFFCLRQAYLALKSGNQSLGLCRFLFRACAAPCKPVAVTMQKG